MTTTQAAWIVACSTVVLQIAWAAQDPNCYNSTLCSKLNPFDLPECTPNAKPTSVYECAEKNVQNGKSCREFVKRSFQSYRDGVRLAEKTLCDTEGLRGAFVTQKVCWRVAVSCVAGYFGSSRSQDQTPDQCRQSIHGATKCTEETPKECLSLHRRFLDHAMARTPCHGYNQGQSHGATLLLVIVTMVLAIQVI